MNGVVLLALPCDVTNIVHHALSPEVAFRAVILEKPISKKEFLRRRVRKLGVRRVAGQVMFQALVARGLRVASRRRVAELKTRLGLDDRPIDESLVTRVESANDAATIELLRRLDPAVVVVNGTRILSREVLGCISGKFINTHAGITPLYRGVHGGYWALVDGKPAACGVTVHLVNEGIDTGVILGQATIQPEPQDNFVTYPYLQLAAALPLLQRAVRELLAGRVATLPPPPGPSKMWTHPTAMEYLWHRLRRGVR